jgi:hypothetical protein
VPSYTNSFWGFISIETRELTLSDDPFYSHHNSLARKLCFRSKEEYMLETQSIAFDVPTEYSDEARADFICPTTKDKKAIRAIMDFLIKYRNLYGIEYLDITGYRGLPLPVNTVDEFFDAYPY